MLSSLPDTARLWIYQSDRELTPLEVKQIESKAKQFLVSWNTHGTMLSAAIEVVHDRFIVIGVDEKVTSASGCSIDKSVHFVRDLGEAFRIDFFNRLNVAYRAGKEIEIVSMQQFEELAQNGVVNAETITFNNMIERLGDYYKNWEVKAGTSWHSRLLPTTI